MEPPASEEWRDALIHEALLSVSVELRDADVQADEEWGGTLIKGTLSEHRQHETEEWLVSYIDGVIADLRT